MSKFGELGLPLGFMTDRHIRFALAEETLVAPGTWSDECMRHASYH